jgi:hypothetical protein
MCFAAAAFPVPPAQGRLTRLLCAMPVPSIDGVCSAHALRTCAA